MPCTHQDTHIHFNLTRLPDYASVRSEIETFFEARQSSSNPDEMDFASLNGQKGVCRICGQRGHSAASCPKRGKSDQGGKGQGKKGKSSKGPPTMFFLSAANNVFSLCRQQCFFSLPPTMFFLSAANNVFSLCRQQCFFSLPPTMFFLSAAKMFFPTGSHVQDVGFRVLPNVTEEGLHRCMNFRVAPVHKALVSASKVCREGYRIILDSEPGQSGMLHKRTNEWIGLREEKGVWPQSSYFEYLARYFFTIVFNL